MEQPSHFDEETTRKLSKVVEKLVSSGQVPDGGQVVLTEQELERIFDDIEESGSSGGGDGSGGDGGAADALASIENFDLRPCEIKEYLDRYVIQQDEAKRVLSVAVCDHYNHVRRALSDPAGYGARDVTKPNILLVGPTGVGKTYLMRTIAKLIGVPFVTADATKFSETGVVGKDAEDLVRDLVAKAEGNATIAQYGIIYVDEVDKIAAPGGVGAEGGGRLGGGFNTRGVQNTFLKLLEDTEVSLASPMQGMVLGLPGMDGPPAPRVSTKNILFVFSGAFTHLDAQIRKKRAKKTSFGFAVSDDDSSVGKSVSSLHTSSDGVMRDSAAASVGDGAGRHSSSCEEAPKPTSEEELGEAASALRYASTADFVEAGLEPEFVGRVPVRVACDSLTSDDLLQVLTSSEGSVLRQMERDFTGYGLELSTTPDALLQVARLAAGEGTGARGLVTVLERTLRGHKFALPSSSLTNFTMDNATVTDPEAALRTLLASESAQDKMGTRLGDAKRYEARLRRQLGEGVQCWLTDEAIDVVVREALEQDVSTFSLCLQRLERLPAALRHVAEKTGQTRFPISASMVRDPDAEIDRWMRMIE